MTRVLLYLALTIILIGACIAGCVSSPGTTPTPTPTTAPPTITTVPPTTTMLPTTTVPSTTTAPSGGTVDIYLQAKHIAFNKSTISVPAGAIVNVHFDNEDQGTPHNFAVYTNSQATTAIFQGTIITGVSQTTYTFTAPSSPGDYFFRCDVHPSVMYGTFTVTS
jgi:plastocyanin